jgi:hypothetical protein
MRLQTDRIVVSRSFQSTELSDPVNIAFIDRRPHNLSIRIFNCILAMTVVNSILGQTVPTPRIGIHLAPHHGIAGIPVERQMRRLNSP